MLTNIKSILKLIVDVEKWSLFAIQINQSKSLPTSYIAKELYIDPYERIDDLIEEISQKYIGEKGILESTYTAVSAYDGSADAKTIYKLKSTSELLEKEFVSFINAISVPDMDVSPFDLNLKALVYSGVCTEENEQIRILLISMQNPVTVLRNKYWSDNGTFKELDKKVLSLRTSIDVIIYGEDIYFLTFAGENLFNMEHAYKSVAKDFITHIGDSGIICNFETFSKVANSGHNPRRFISFDESHLTMLKKPSIRKQIAKKFVLPLIDGKFDTTNEEYSEKLVKILCNKGMVDPFESSPMEVSSARKWE